MRVLDFKATEGILSRYRIPFYRTYLATSKKEALKLVDQIGYPLVLKIYSLDIIHKTDVGGVRKGIKNKGETARAWSDIMSQVSLERPKAKIEGIAIQKQGGGVEIVMGMKRDSQFGPVLMFGLGGIFVEILRDISFCIAPVSKKDAKEMIKEIKGYKVLTGFRGREMVNIKSLVDIIIELSRLSLECREIQEIDFNPVFVDEKGARVADAKIIIHDK